jgi:glucose/arabinose dehydrogenase
MHRLGHEMSTAPPTPRTLELTKVTGGLNFPTGITFDPDGASYVSESGLPFAGAPRGGRILRLDGDEPTVLLDSLAPPVNGVTHHDGHLYVTVGGSPSQILRLPVAGGEPEVIVDGLPGPGNYQPSMVAFGPDDKLYFAQGAMTNLGIIGLDALDLGWLGLLHHEPDVPGLEIELRGGVAVETDDPDHPGQRATTGPFARFGSEHPAGTRMPAQLPCSSAVMRCQPDGSELELVAWGVRNGFGLLFLPDGRLIVTDQGSDDRGSRPIGNAPELLFEIVKGEWYGWPDFIGDVPVTEDRFKPEQGDPPQFILANHDELPRPHAALAEIETHAAACKMDNMPDGRVLIALFGDEVPMTAPSGPKAGRALAIADPDCWSIERVLVPGLERPIDVRYGPDGSLHVVDFGHFEPARGSMEATAGSGGVWKALPGHI